MKQEEKETRRNATVKKRADYYLSFLVEFVLLDRIRINGFTVETIVRTLPHGCVSACIGRWQNLTTSGLNLYGDEKWNKKESSHLISSCQILVW